MADRDCRNNDRECHGEAFVFFDEEIEDANWFDGVDFDIPPGMGVWMIPGPIFKDDQDG